MTIKKFKPDTLMEYVKDFHTSARMPTRTEVMFVIPEKTLRIALIDEEVKELRDAYNDRDFIEVIDALADIAYVVAGAAWCHGLFDLDLGCVETVPQAGVNPGFSNNFSLDDLDEAISRIETAGALYSELLSQEVITEESLKALLELLMKECYVTSNNLGVNLHEVLAEVQNSNMSKFDKDGNPYLNPDTGKVMKGPDFFRPDLHKVIFGAKSK